MSSTNTRVLNDTSASNPGIPHNRRRDSEATDGESPRTSDLFLWSPEQQEVHDHKITGPVKGSSRNWHITRQQPWIKRDPDVNDSFTLRLLCCSRQRYPVIFFIPPTFRHIGSWKALCSCIVLCFEIYPTCAFNFLLGANWSPWIDTSWERQASHFVLWKWKDWLEWKHDTGASRRRLNMWKLTVNHGFLEFLLLPTITFCLGPTVYLQFFPSVCSNSAHNLKVQLTSGPMCVFTFGRGALWRIYTAIVT